MNYRLIVCIFYLLGIPTLLFGQNRFNQFYELENIQSKELIKGIAKDQHGFVWVATDEGVLRYDGNETLLFFKELPSPYTKDFLLTQDNRFLVTHDAGLTEIINQNDSVYLKPYNNNERTIDQSFNYPKSIYEDKDGNIWLGEVNSVVRMNQDGLKRFNLGADFQSISYHHNFSFAEDAFGNLWIAPFKGKLLSYNKSEEILEEVNVDHPITEVSKIINVRGDYLIISGKEGYAQLKIDSDKNILETKINRQVNNISDAVVIGEELYIGTWEDGLYYGEFNSQGMQFEKLPNVEIIDIIALYFDRSSQELWIAGSENIGLLKNTPVKTIFAAGNHRIESITKNNEAIYFSIGQEVFSLNPSFNIPAVSILHLDDSYFSEIFLEENLLWVGDSFGRVFYINLENNTRSDLISKPSLPSNQISINQIFKDTDGNKWFTGNANGLIKVQADKSYKFYTELDTTQSMIQNNNGLLLCGSNSRDSLLHVYDEVADVFQLIEVDFQFEFTDRFLLNDLKVDQQNDLWAATSIGLLKIPFENGGYEKVERVEVPGFNISEPIRAIAIKNDRMFLANNYGLVLIEKENSVLFNKDSGLPSKIIKDAGLEFMREDKLLISTSRGMAFLDLDKISITKSNPPIFKSVTVNSEFIHQDSTLIRNFRYKSNIEADFISLSFPGKTLEYQTRILGLDDSWSKPTTNTKLSVLGFSEGSYTVQVRASESGHFWSDPISFSFTISQPWYRSWWAILGFILLSAMVIFISMKIHNRNLIVQKKNLQKIIEQRTEEINRQKNEIIEQQEKIIKQKEELLEKNQTVYKSQQALNEADMNFLHLKEKQLQEQIEYKNKQITTHTLNIIQKNESLKDLQEKLESLIKKSDSKTVAELRKTIKIIDESFKLDKDWEDFKLYFEQIYTGFYAKLQATYHDITPLEMRHCALVRLNLTIQECASILGISPDSVKVSRTRLRKKLNLPHEQSLSDFIMGI